MLVYDHNNTTYLRTYITFLYRTNLIITIEISGWSCTVVLFSREMNSLRIFYDDILAEKEDFRF